MASFSEILIREREKKGLSKADLARKLNIPYTTYQNYENGREPKIEVIKDISKALNIDPSVFFDLENADDLFDYVYYPNSHNEVEDIKLYDSGKIFAMKESFDQYHSVMYDRYMKLHYQLSEFFDELKKFRSDYFVRFDQDKIHSSYLSISDIIERSNIDAEYHYQKTVYESQFMDEDTINQYKTNNPDYKLEIIRKVLFDKQDYDFDTSNEEIVDALYQIALKKYFPDK